MLELLEDGLPDYLPVRPAVAWEAEPRWAAGPAPSAAALEALLRHAAAPGEWWLGVAEGPLLGRGGQPVFGEATVGGPAAVVALAPLRAEGDDADFRRRVLVSALHELGHLAGAEHCHDPACLMHPSRSLAETDAKRPFPCDRCGAVVRHFFEQSA